MSSNHSIPPGSNTNQSLYSNHPSINAQPSTSQQPSPAPPPPSTTAKQKQRKQTQSPTVDDDPDDETYTGGDGNGNGNGNAAKKRKRNRVVLSCTNCKARKIKCDRQIPGCSSCQRRGLSHTCRWGDERDDAFLGAERSNEALMTRIRELESLVTNLTNKNDNRLLYQNAPEPQKVPVIPSNSFSNDSRSIPASREQVSNSNAKVKKEGKARSTPRNAQRQLSDEESNESDTEDAAQVLEAMANGLPSFNQERKATLPSLSRSYHDGNQSSNNLDNQDNARSAEGSSRNGPFNSNVDSSSRPSIINRKSNDKFSLPSLPSLSNLSVVPALPSMNINSQDSQIEQCLRLLPKMKDLKNIALWYLEEIDPILNCLNSVIFKQQLSEFEFAFNARMSTSPISSPMSIDLSFLALLFAVLSASAEYRTSSELVRYGFASNEDSMDMTLESYYCSSITLLGLSDFGERPSMNGLSSIVALSHYAFARRKQQSYGALVVMSLRLAEVLGIHKLGSALDDAERWKRETSNNPSSDDPLIPNGGKLNKTRRLSTTSKDSHSSSSFGSTSSRMAGQGKDRERQPLHGMFLPPGLVQLRESETQYADYSHSKRETARSVWLALCVLETFTSSHVGSSTYLASSNGITTAFPMNLEDEEIPNSESGDYSITPHPFEVPTTKRFIPLLYQVGLVARKIVDSMIAGEGYSAMSEIDSNMMEIKSKLPKFFVYDGVTEHTEEMKELHRKHPYLTFQRILLNEWIFHRLLQCHRIYMTRGYRNPKYKFSLDRSIECAQGVIEMRREMDVYMKAAPDRQARANYGLLTVHLFQAASALQMYLLHQVNARESISHHLLKDIEDAVVYLEAHPSGQTRQAMAQNAIDVLQKLRREMTTRLSPEAKTRSNTVGSQSQINNNPHQSSPSTLSQQQPEQYPNQSHQNTFQHFRSNTSSNLSNRSWNPINEDQVSFYSPNKTNDSQPRANAHLRAATWQSNSSTPVHQAQDQVFSQPGSRSNYPSPHLPHYQSPQIHHPPPNYLSSNPIPNEFNSASNTDDSAQLPFDLDDYLKTVSVTIPGERGDRVFQTLDGLLVTNGSPSTSNPGQGGVGIGAAGLPGQANNRNHSAGSPNGFNISSTTNIHSFPIPPQVPAPIPQTVHYGYGITTAPAGSSDFNNHHPSNLPKHNSPYLQSSNSPSMNQLPYQPSPPSHHSSASNSPHLHPSQQFHYQAQQRSMANASAVGGSNGFRAPVNHHSPMSNQNIYMNNR